MTDIETIEKRYYEWYSKLRKNLSCTKGSAAKKLLVQTQSLKLNEDLLGCWEHIKKFSNVVREFSVEEDSLRWVVKLVQACDRWGSIFESLTSRGGVDADTLIRALLAGEIDIDDAIGSI